jgi:hypothetical protein
MRWSFSDSEAAFEESHKAISLLGKRKRKDQNSVLINSEERAALLSIRKLRLAYHSRSTKVISVSNIPVFLPILESTVAKSIRIGYF